ncbi:MAG TPA: peptidase inhibitor family I36 protein [Galbitalea sp.]
MRTIQSAIAATVGASAIALTLTLAGASCASATTPNPTAAATPAATAEASCWLDITTGQSLCVPDGVSLVATVEATTGIVITVPAGTVVGGVAVSKGLASASLLTTASAQTSHVVSALYDDINYGGGTYLMTASAAGCNWGIASLVGAGWNDRASSFKSYSGCTTAIYQNTNYGGTRLGFATNKASFGSMNDAASSWKTQ